MFLSLFCPLCREKLEFEIKIFKNRDFPLPKKEKKGKTGFGEDLFGA